LLGFDEYDKLLISFSGGKDSLAMILHMLEIGFKKSQIELWHQCVDGKEHTRRPFFDWPSTEGYIIQVADYLGLRLDWQWRAFGFHGELFRQDSLTGDVFYKNDEEFLVYTLPTTKGKKTTRKRFPAKSANLQTRWCSSALKIDVARRVVNNRPDLKGNKKRPFKILWITGERREESPARAGYNAIEHHPGNTKRRIVHQWRPMLDWTEQEIWRIIEKHRIMPHPVYYLGFPRLSCRSCIFFTKDHWSTLLDVSPRVIRMLRAVEKDLDFTIDGKFTVEELAGMGKSRINEANRIYIRKAVEKWNEAVTTENWQLPSGAFGGNESGSR
jgi:3'-phosphoadenosine 5'-phosphosulfate sulfotransferase (PAPS reductase)/FAD synthetase